MEIIEFKGATKVKNAYVEIEGTQYEVVPAEYSGTIRVSYEIPLLWKISYAVNAVFFIGIIAAVIYDKRRNRLSVINEGIDE